MTTSPATAAKIRNVWRPLRALPGRWELVFTLTRRELATRYRGTWLGTVWAVLTPVMMIAIYTFIFAEIFGARFGTQGTSLDYALYLFCGLLPWNAFQEAVQTSANVVVAQANLVKRVRFPLETLPVAQTLVAFAHQLFGTVALVVAVVVIRRELHHTLLWLPVLMLPQLLLTAGAALLVASLGVFLRDTAQTLTLLLAAWMFLTPIIYPETVVPERYRFWIALNPFTPLVRNYRHVILDGRPPDWAALAYFFAFACAVFPLGCWWFAKTRRGFADVL